MNAIFYVYEPTMTIEEFRALAVRCGFGFPEIPRAYSMETFFPISLGDVELWAEFAAQHGENVLVSLLVPSEHVNFKPAIELLEKNSNIRTTDDPEMLEWSET